MIETLEQEVLTYNAPNEPTPKFKFRFAGYEKTIAKNNATGTAEIDTDYFNTGTSDLLIFGEDFLFVPRQQKQRLSLAEAHDIAISIMRSAEIRRQNEWKLEAKFWDDLDEE
ncbi:MAG: hypothetical protein QGM50_11995 [Anaerolineae bacterium]|nr:hypothetical protein [Anaerolineae bacterium]